MRLPRLFRRSKTDPLLAHLEVGRVPEGMSDKQLSGYFAKRGIEWMGRVATPGDLFAGMEPDEKAAAIAKYANNLKPSDWQIPEGYQWMRTPDGILCTVPNDEIEACIAKGWKKD